MHISEDLLTKLRHVRLLVLDVDGTLTDGGIYLGPQGEEFKRFDAHDGHGIVMLQKEHGLEVVFLSGRSCEPVSRRAKELGVAVCLQGHYKKAEELAKLVSTRGLQPQEIAVMGDDLGDLEMMRSVGFSFAPHNAHYEVKKHANYVTTRKGGDGAVREACDLIIAALSMPEPGTASPHAA
jgi:3-deoxy-D-manno-octulosonate 8-phosphate phosphatase (KDO 8-P phosphatase)